ncbi:glutamate racemase [Novosphingopyxis baekryungensis]|uniref:glutamate racemase n=1 Tax=Novosphingopyxis baekryungensis TaxID=279369 RepID=UPI0003B43236|nr:glutamate racemase [Novosphingopyxis baekryungensis]
MLPAAPILLFDSGVGGLSILRALKKAAPHAPIVYAADFAGLPYGSKTEAEIAARVPALLGRLVERYRPRLVTIACNTASTIALPAVRAALDIPVVGTVPAVKPAALQTRSGVIGLIGTEATIRQTYVDNLLREHGRGATLIRIAAPELVEAAERKLRGQANDTAVFAGVIGRLLAAPDAEGMDIVVLACTHFPLLTAELAAAAPPGLRFIDGADGIARRILHLCETDFADAPPADGLFVSTGSGLDASRYAEALLPYGLTRFETL